MAEKEEKKQKLAAEKAEKARIKAEEAQKKKLEAEEKKRELALQKQKKEEEAQLRVEAEKLKAQKLAANPPVSDGLVSQLQTDHVQNVEAETSEPSETLEKIGKKRKLYSSPALTDDTPEIDPETHTAVLRNITGSEYMRLGGDEDVKPKRGRKAVASTSNHVETPKRSKRVKESSVEPEGAGKFKFYSLPFT